MSVAAGVAGRGARHFVEGPVHHEARFHRNDAPCPEGSLQSVSTEHPQCRPPFRRAADAWLARAVRTARDDGSETVAARGACALTAAQARDRVGLTGIGNALRHAAAAALAIDVRHTLGTMSLRGVAEEIFGPAIFVGRALGAADVARARLGRSAVAVRETLDAAIVRFVANVTPGAIERVLTSLDLDAVTHLASVWALATRVVDAFDAQMAVLIAELAVRRALLVRHARHRSGRDARVIVRQDRAALGRRSLRDIARSRAAQLHEKAQCENRGRMRPASDGFMEANPWCGKETCLRVAGGGHRCEMQSISWQHVNAWREGAVRRRGCEDASLHRPRSLNRTAHRRPKAYAALVSSSCCSSRVGCGAKGCRTCIVANAPRSSARQPLSQPVRLSEGRKSRYWAACGAGSPSARQHRTDGRAGAEPRSENSGSMSRFYAGFVHVGDGGGVARIDGFLGDRAGGAIGVMRDHVQLLFGAGLVEQDLGRRDFELRDGGRDRIAELGALADPLQDGVVVGRARSRGADRRRAAPARSA